LSVRANEERNVGNKRKGSPRHHEVGVASWKPGETRNKKVQSSH